MQYPRTKKPRKISDAVFRGKSSAYNFQVFPLTADIADTPGVFILSRRRTDKFGHGHQSAVCIGETNSIAAELKKHKRAKCVKNNEPNVVCILTEENAAARTGVIKDLTAARKFGCIRNVYDSTIKPKSYEPIKLSGRRRRVASEPAVETKPTPTKNADAAKAPKKAVAARADSKPVVKGKAVAKTVKTKQARSVAAAPKRKQIKAVAEAKRKSTKQAPVAKAAPAKRVKTTRVAAAAPAKRVTSVKPAAPAKNAKKRTAVKSKIVQPKLAARPAAAKQKSSPAKRVKTVAAKTKTTAKTKPKAKSAVTAKRSAAAGTGSRVQGGVDSNRRQHRLPKPAKPVNKRTKSRADSKPRSRQKAAA